MNLSVHEKLSIFLNRLRGIDMRGCNSRDVADEARAIALEMVDEFEVAE